MRGKIFFFVTLCMIALLAGQAYHTFWVREKSPTVYAEMAPVEPRALLFGDYMEVGYAFEGPSDKKDVVLYLNERNILQQKETAGEKFLVKFEQGRYRIPHQYFFQEGHAQKYENARYAALKKIGKNTFSLVGLTDENLNLID